MNNYKACYYDYWGVYKEADISANTRQEAQEKFDYQFGDCKLIILHG